MSGCRGDRMIKKKKITKDLFYSITAVGLMNAVLQFIVYPIINNKVGAAAFGDMLFFLGVVSVLSPSFGIAANNTRLLLAERDTAKNGDFVFALSIFSVISAIVGIIVSIYRGNSFLGAVLFIYIIVITMFRNYSSVEYRLKLNYKIQFVFYLILSIGYILGTLLFFVIKRWELVYIIGETAAVAFVVLTGQIFSNIRVYSERKNSIFKNALTLSANYIITNLMLNLDRIVLLNFVGNEAVSQYYVLSLMGKTIAIISGPLNGILIGYLTKGEEKIKRKGFYKMGGILFAAGCLFLTACVVVTPIYIKIMYPNLYGEVISLNFIVNLSQIFYFLAGIVVVVTLTVCSAKSILIIQIIYSIVFIILSVALTSWRGISGFAYAAVISNVLYFFMVYFTGMISAKK